MSVYTTCMRHLQGLYQITVLNPTTSQQKRKPTQGGATVAKDGYP